MHSRSKHCKQLSEVFISGSLCHQGNRRLYQTERRLNDTDLWHSEENIKFYKQLTALVNLLPATLTSYKSNQNSFSSVRVSVFFLNNSRN
jgi:hypothetical protein